MVKTPTTTVKGNASSQNTQIEKEPVTPGTPSVTKAQTSTTTIVRKGRGRGKQTSTVSVLDTIQDGDECPLEVEGEEFEESDSDATG